MSKPVVAIIGRPNVGKSTLFNKIIGKRAALVHDMPGVTRDRNFSDTSFSNKLFTIMDTGGFEPVAKEGLISQIKEQTKVAIEEADVLILIVDGNEGLTTTDLEVTKVLRKANVKFLLAVNKIDDHKHTDRIHDFYKIGCDDIFPISAEHSIGISDLLDKVVSLIPEYTPLEKKEGEVRIAVVGKPNVGKSSLINNILNENRLLVSPVAGTTMDSVDTVYEKNNKRYIFVDTAGMRKKIRISQKIEKYSMIMSLRSIERCDIALVLVDAKEGINEQDVKIAGYVHEAGKGAIIVLNKWDLVKKETQTLKEYTEIVKSRLKYMAYAPVHSISATTGQRVHKLFDLIDKIVIEQTKKIPTPQLNDVIETAVKRRHPPSYRGKHIKFYYTSQVKTSPPTFLCFVNIPQGIHFSYDRYIQNTLRREFGFTGTPINMVYKGRGKRIESKKIKT